MKITAKQTRHKDNLYYKPLNSVELMERIKTSISQSIVGFLEKSIILKEEKDASDNDVYLTTVYVLTEKDWNEIREHLSEIKKLSGYCDSLTEAQIANELGTIQRIIIE